MLHSQLNKLPDMLLRGGISPGHVRRYVNELSDHYDDLLAHARASGATAADAERDALARIGAPDELANAMLAREDLKSVAARHPVLTFGFAPLVVLILSAAAAVLVPMSIVMALKPPAPETFLAPGWLKSFAEDWLAFILYVLPVLVAGAIAAFGLRQRVRFAWIALAVATVGIFGGFYDIGIEFPSVPGEHGELTAGLGFMSPFPDMPESFIRAAINILIVGLPVFWLHRRQSATA